MPLKQIEAEALQLPPMEQKALIHSLIVHRDRDPNDTAEDVAAAWDAEIARRVAAMDRGEVEWVPADQVFVEIEDTLRKASE